IWQELRELRVGRHVIVKCPVEVAVGLRTARRGGRELGSVEGKGNVGPKRCGRFGVFGTTRHEIPSEREAENGACRGVDRKMHAGDSAVDRDPVCESKELLAPRLIAIGGSWGGLQKLPQHVRRNESFRSVSTRKTTVRRRQDHRLNLRRI